MATDAEKVAAAILTQARLTALGTRLSDEVTKVQEGTAAKTFAEGARKLVQDYYSESLEAVK